MLICRVSSAFPEMQRHAYTNCTACHISPAGGGVLTPYGKGLSNEVLTTWKEPEEEPVEKWWHIGGDYRGVQRHFENENVRDGKYIRMQAGLEFAANYERLVADIFVGQFKNIEGDWGPNSPNYYLMYKANDEVNVRAGRFIPVFGLNIPEHIFSTRQDLGFMPFNEFDTAEVSYLGETWSFYLSSAKNSEKISASTRESGISTQLNFTFWERFKVGLSYWNSVSELQDRQIVGLHGILGFSHNFYLLSETDLQWSNLKSLGGQRGVFHFQKLGYEVVQGLHLFLLEDFKQLETGSQVSDIKRTYGLGFQFFPYPHIDIEGVFSKQQTLPLAEKYADYAWFMLHLYL